MKIELSNNELRIIYETLQEKYCKCMDLNFINPVYKILKKLDIPVYERKDIYEILYPNEIIVIKE